MKYQYKNHQQYRIKKPQDKTFKIVYLFIQRYHRIYRCHGDNCKNTNTFYFPPSVEMLTMTFQFEFINLT